MVSKGFLNVVTSSQQYNIGKKPTVILHTYNNRHAGTPKPQSRNTVRYKGGLLFNINVTTIGESV